MAYPTDKTTFDRVSSGKRQDSPNHRGLHNDLADVIEALEDKVGIDNSTVPTSHDYLLRHLPQQAADLNMGGFKVSNIGSATEATDAVQKKQVILKDGTNKMAANLDMDSHKIVNLQDPTNAQEAVTKNYADTKFSSGWIQISDTYSYSSWNSTTGIGVITVSSGATSRYWPGMRIKYTQNSNVKYGTIVNVTDTSISVFHGGSYTLENATISDVYISPSYVPGSFPRSSVDNSFWVGYSSDISLTIDNAWHTLNLSSYIPAGTKAVMLKFGWTASSAINDVTLYLRKQSGATEWTALRWRGYQLASPIPTVDRFTACTIAEVTSSRTLDYKIPCGSSATFNVLAYWTSVS